MTHIVSSMHPAQTPAAPLLRASVLVFKNNPAALQDFQVDWQPWLFNTPQHAHYQAINADCYTFMLVKNKQLLAFFHLFVPFASRVGMSPAAGSFGGLETHPRLPRTKQQVFLEEVVQFAQRQGITALHVKLPPRCYAPAALTHAAEILQKNGFSLNHTFDNQHIEVSNTPFEQHLHLSELRRLRKCQRLGFSFELLSQPNLTAVYAFIAQNRHTLGYPMTFTEADLRAWFALFPAYYHIFCVKHQQQMVALTVAVRVGEGVLYNFYPADCLAYRTFSPTVLLTAGLYQYCQQQHISRLDLGVSTNATGQPKESLQRFKRNLGAVDSLKTTWIKSLPMAK